MKAEVLDEIRLLRAYADRKDQEALVALFAPYQDQLYAFALRVLHNSDDAQDAIQMTFIDVMRRAGEYDRIGSVRGWLFGMVRKSCALILKSGKRRIERESLAAREHATKMNAKDSFRQEAIDLKDAVSAILGHLPERYRDALMLCYCHGLSEAETAEVLGEKEGTVRVQLSRGLEMVRTRLAAGGIALGAMALPDLLANLPTQASPAALAQNLGKLARNELPNSISRYIARHPARNKGVPAWVYGAVAVAMLGATAYLLKGAPAKPARTPAPAAAPSAAPDVLEAYRYSFEKGLPEDITIMDGTGGWRAKAGPFQGVLQMDREGVFKIAKKFDTRPLRARMRYCVFLSMQNKEFNCSLHRLYPAKGQPSLDWHKKLQISAVEGARQMVYVGEVTYYWIDRYIFIFSNDELTHVTEFDRPQNTDGMLLQLRNGAVDELEIEVLREAPERLRDPAAYIKSMGIRLSSGGW